MCDFLTLGYFTYCGGERWSVAIIDYIKLSHEGYLEAALTNSKHPCKVIMLVFMLSNLKTAVY